MKSYEKIRKLVCTLCCLVEIMETLCNPNIFMSLSLYSGLTGIAVCSQLEFRNQSTIIRAALSHNRKKENFPSRSPVQVVSQVFIYHRRCKSCYLHFRQITR